jgi:hypothetical protein
MKDSQVEKREVSRVGRDGEGGTFTFVTPSRMRSMWKERPTILPSRTSIAVYTPREGEPLVGAPWVATKTPGGLSVGVKEGGVEDGTY